MGDVKAGGGRGSSKKVKVGEIRRNLCNIKSLQLKKGLIIRGGCQEKTEELGMQGMGGRGSGLPVTPHPLYHLAHNPYWLWKKEPYPSSDLAALGRPHRISWENNK